MNLLLLSNSTNVGSPMLEHAWPAILDALGPIGRVTFVPYALADHDAYTATVRAAFATQGIDVVSVHESADPVAAVTEAEAVYVGGGNTFRLLETARRLGVLDALRAHADAGKVYLSASAGTNVAAPTIRTTNDMPIVFPNGFDALALVPFQINCHYLDADPTSTHAGETREVRLTEYLEENTTPVVGLREGTWIRVIDSVATIGGVAVNPAYGPARLFTPDAVPTEISGDITSLLNAVSVG